MDKLLGLKEWLTIRESANYTTRLIGSRIKTADILRLALDGHLQMSVVLPGGTQARRIEPEGKSPISTSIEGLWDLPMTGPERGEVTSLYHSDAGLPHIDFDVRRGAFVRREDDLFQVVPYGKGHSGLYPTNPSCFPAGTTFAIRRVALEQLAETLQPPEANESATAPDRGALERPLHERERITLLTIIGALAAEAKIDLAHTYQAADRISAIVDRIGAKVSTQTIQLHLKRVSEALERKSR